MDPARGPGEVRVAGTAHRRVTASWTWWRRVGLLLVTVAVVEYAAVYLVAGARRSWSSVGGASPELLLGALLLEVASWACFSRLTSALLAGPGQPRYPTVLAIDLTGNGVSHVVPGGGATAAALRLRLLDQAGVPRAGAVGAAALESAIAVLWLVVALVAGLVVAVPHPQTRPFLQAASVLSVVLVAVMGGLVAVLVARPDQLVTVTHAVARRLPLVRGEALERLARGLVDRVRLVLASRTQVRRALLWGLATWVLDAACLFVCVAAFGDVPDPGGLLTTYALVSLLALLPTTPGGLGLVEGVAVPALLSFGTAHDAALLGVLAWRLLEFWLPIPVALVAFGWLRVRQAPRRHVRRASAPGRRTRDRR